MSDPTAVTGTTWADYLRQARTAKGWTIDELAAQSGVSRMTIIRWEQGSAGFSIPTLERVARALDIPSATAIAVARGEVGADALPAVLPPLAEEIATLLRTLPPADRIALATVLDAAVHPYRERAKVVRGASPAPDGLRRG